MRILGVDPGLARTGWALLAKSASADMKLLESGLLETAPETALADRLHYIHQKLFSLIERLRPEEMAIEELFFLKAAHSIAGTLQARGVILLAAAQAGLMISQYNPRTVKLTLTGSGSALKPQIQRLVQSALRLPDILRPDDVADAAAIALCHVRSNRYKKLRVLDRIGGRR